jgi:uncharacterized protein YdhG (YjbR/CyaY superfamily)
MKSAEKNTPSPRKNTAAAPKKRLGFTEEERAAMREYVKERNADARSRNGDPADGESAVLAKIAALAPLDRTLAERIHSLVKVHAPALSPKTWYGMPAYARNGNVVCFFQSAQKFKTRYATLGFSDKANLDNGSMWPTVFALKEMTAENEAQIVALLKKALS